MDRIALFLVLCGLLAPPAGSAEKVATIENTRLRLQFSRSNGGLKSFTVLRSGDNYLKSNAATPPPFSLTVGDADGKRQGEAYPAQAVTTVQGGTATIRSNSVLLGDENVPIYADVKVELQPDTAETRWTIHLENRSQTKTVFSVTLPRLNGVRLGANWQDDALYFPFWGGERFPHAVSDFELLGERRLPALEMGNPRVTRVGDRYVHELHYAGGASMMWMDYADASQGLYVASYDPDFRVTVLHADTAGPSAAAMNFEIRKWVTVPPGQSWNSAPLVVAAHGSDWHWSADQYRAWFHQHVPLVFPGAAWRERTGGWLVFMKNAYGAVKFRFAELPALWLREKQLGMDLLIAYGWSLGGFDAYDPEYYPDLDLGGPMAMARAYQQIRQDGGHLMTYINGRIFNVNSIFFKTLGEKWAARKPDGSYWVETYKPGSPESFAVMCPHEPGWRNLLADFGEMAVRDYAADLIYYDQVAAARPVECYGAGRDTGTWNQNYVSLLQQASLAARRHNPDVAFMIEGAGDLYTPYAVFQSYLSPLQAGTRFAFPELYKYTFPEAIQASLVLVTRQSSDSLYPVFPSVPRETAERWLCRDIINGNLVAFLDAFFDDGGWRDEVEQLLALRKAAAPWLGRGTFRDNIDVVSADPELEVKTFRLDEGLRRNTLVEIFNAKRAEQHRITVRTGPLVGLRAYRLHPAGARTEVPVVLSNGEVSVEAPSELLSMIVLEASRL